METQFQKYFETFGIETNLCLCDRSKDIFRRSLLTCPSLGGSERCRILVSIQIACEEQNTPFEQNTAAKLSASTKRQYKIAYDAVTASSRLESEELAIETLLTQTSADTMRPQCHYLVEKAYSAHLTRKGANSQMDIRKNDKNFVISVFLICSEILGLKRNIDAIIHRYGGNKKYIAAITEFIRRYNKEDLNNLEKTTMPPTKEKATVKKNDNICIVNSHYMDNFSRSKEYQEFVKWKTHIKHTVSGISLCDLR